MGSLEQGEAAPVFNGVLLKKELNQAKWAIAILLLILGATALSLPFAYSITAKYLQSPQLAVLPETIRRDLALIKDFPSFIWGNWFGKNLFQISYLAAITLAVQLFGEVKHPAMGFLLTKPFSRRGVFANKFFVGALALAGMIAISTVLLFLEVNFIGQQLVPSLLVQGVLVNILGAWAVFAVTVFLVVRLVSAGKAVLVMWVVTAAVVGASIASGGAFNPTGPLACWGVLRGEGFPWIGLLVYAVITIALYLLARGRFEHLDF